MSEKENGGSAYLYEDVGDCIKQLSHLSPGTDEYTEAAASMLTNQKLLTNLRSLLANDSTETADAAPAAQLVAELAKSETARVTLHHDGFIALLVPVMNSDDRELSLQSIRALGNLCYEQDQCREQIVQEKGLAELSLVLQFCVNQHTSHLKLKTASAGFLHNLLNGNEVCIKAVLKTDILSLLRDLLERNAKCDSITSFSYMTFSSIAEMEGGSEALLKADVVSLLLKIFVHSNIADTDDVLLSILSAMASDCDEVKKLFAESSLDMHLLKIISLLSSKTDEDSQQLVKAASELLVLVLTGDEAMKIWFDGGEGYVFASVSEWLQSTNGQLLQSAAFAIGNFARGESNGDIIIQRGISLELYKSLDQLQGVADDARTAPTIHAILSALRNMAIAPRNKIQLLEQRIMGHILPYMKSDNSIVTSKLVGVVRLLIDGQEEESTILGQNEEVIRRLVEFGDSQTNALLMGESTRCLAWIAKNSRDLTALDTLLQQGAFKHFVSLISSDHAVMQSEGIIAVMVMCKSLPEDTKRVIKESSLIPTLVKMLSRKEEIAIELLGNGLLLVSECINLGLKEELKNAEGLQECIELLPSKTSDSKTLDMLTYITRCLRT
ncbi:rap1 GTPase-GDP dissociation stimulator 1-B-like [Watersipora subatra]|uniref:rap1 GTPase-GDP dissociation stimulator 1-B-like n=1 Tax=Watersipora subatra TaxID=2589382 RepID=UPI00355BA888